MKRCILTICLALPTVLLAQDRPKDPFATPPSIKQAARRDVDTPQGRAQRPERVQLILRGSLKLRGKPAAGLLQIGKQTLLVRVGDQLRVASRTLHIKSIQGSTITVRWDDEQPITVR